MWRIPVTPALPRSVISTPPSTNSLSTKMIPYNNTRSARRNDPGTLRGPALGDYMNSWEVPIPRSARRRWRRRARVERLVQEANSAPISEGEFGFPSFPRWPEEDDAGEHAPRYRPPGALLGSIWETPDAPESMSQPELPAPRLELDGAAAESLELSPRVLAAIEYVWGLEQNPSAAFETLNTAASLNPSKIGRAAEQGALLLDVFSRVKPVNDNQLTAVQKGLVTNALSSVLEITREIRILAIGAGEEIGRLPVPEDPELSVYLGCVVCYASVSEMLLVPCHHLALCEGCCDEIHARARDEAVTATVRCPVCRSDVLETVKIFRG